MIFEPFHYVIFKIYEIATKHIENLQIIVKIIDLEKIHIVKHDVSEKICKTSKIVYQTRK